MKAGTHNSVYFEVGSMGIAGSATPNTKTADTSQAYASGCQALNDGDYKTAHRNLLKASNEHHLEAQVMLASLFEEGKGFKGSMQHDAEFWYKEAAKHGSSTAQFMLANMYEKGVSTSEPDYAEALVYYTQAANGCNVNAQYKLGCIYATGACGVRIDMSRAVAYMRAAAETGHIEAKQWMEENGEEYYDNAVDVYHDTVIPPRNIHRKQIIH